MNILLLSDSGDKNWFGMIGYTKEYDHKEEVSSINLRDLEKVDMPFLRDVHDQKSGLGLETR